MDEKKKQELAGLLGIIGSGAGVVGSLAGGGSLISNALGTNRAIDDLYQRRILDESGKFTIGSLNPQQKAAVKRLTGLSVLEFDPKMPITKLPVNINGRQYLLGEIVFNPDVGITSKLGKGASALQMREAINQLIVPVQQTVLSQAQDKVGRRQVIKDVASQHVAAGGLMPQIDSVDGKRRINMVGQGTSAAAIRQGALGSTAPTSSLITNEGFADGPRTSFNEIAQRLPQGHPSAITGQRELQMQSSAYPPVPPVEPAPEPVTRTRPMATQSNNFVGPETYPERQGAYRQAVKQLQPTGLKRLLPKVTVPGTGMQAVKSAGRNIVRGVARAPLGTKIGTGVMVGGLAIKGAADNYAADKMVEDVVKQSGPQQPAQSGGRPAQPAGLPAPTAIQTQVMDLFDSKYSYMSKEDKINEAKRITSKPGQSGAASAALWLKYNAPAK